MNRTNPEAGFGLLEVTIAIGITSFIGLVVASLMNMSRDSTLDAERMSSISEVQNAIRRTLDDERSFNLTLRDPANTASFACLNNGTDCRNQGGEFVLFNSTSSGTPVRFPQVRFTTGAEANFGFTADGAPCDTFGISAAGSQCLFKYVATWRAICPTTQNIKGQASIETACRNPLMDIAATLVVAPTSNTKISRLDPTRYQVRVTKTQAGSDLATLCAMVSGGVYAGGVCNLPTRNGAQCDPLLCGAIYQSFVTGFNADGTPICQCGILSRIFPGQVYYNVCSPLGTVGPRVMLGVDARGSITCADGIATQLVESGAIANPPVSFNPGSPTGDGGGDGGSGGDGGAPGGGDGGMGL